jgi:asparagine synthase (glutamine-hydrolysing)
MSGKRYIALIASDKASRVAWQKASAPVLSALAGFQKQCAGDRMVLIAQLGASLEIGDEGFLIGRVYQRGRPRAVDAIEADTARSIVASHGDWLIRAHWGSYVALIASRERESIEVVRAPLGDLACYIVRSVFGVFIASDIDLLKRLADFVPRIDWPILVQHLAAGDLVGRRTCLEGLDELAGGERLTDCAARQTIDAPWKIWDFVHARNRLHDPIEAARRVRDAVQTAVAARASAHEKIVLRLSGGLDSSIVAACLARANRQFVALTLVTHDRSGDERVHARAVADHLGVPLVEAMRDIKLVDLETSDARGLPRPSARSFTQASMRIAGKVAGIHGATAIFDGGGGDNMFASLQSPAPVADCLWIDGGAGHFWRTARSIGVAGTTSTFEVARRALVRKWTRGPAYRWPVDHSLLSPEACEMSHGAADHPWLVPPNDALPGSAAHVALLAAAQSVVQSRDPCIAIAGTSPLIAQPVAEACLRIPSWLWTRDGHNRAIVRDAFRKALPPTIVDRRDKGAPDSFLIELIEANHARVRAMLSDGVLARHGLLDKAALDSVLVPTNLAKGLGYIRVMQLVDVEAWARSWCGRSAGLG